MTKVAVVRVRGTANLKESVKRTLRFLRLDKPNYMVVLDDFDKYKGMVIKVKDYITWGEISDEVLKDVEKKYDKKKKVYRLAPPKGGHKKGIKLSYKVGGALGYRGKDINDLIKRMM